MEASHSLRSSFSQPESASHVGNGSGSSENAKKPQGKSLRRPSALPPDGMGPVVRREVP